MQAAITEITTTTNSIDFTDSASTSFVSQVSSVFEEGKCTQLVVKKLKGANSYNGAVQQVQFIYICYLQLMLLLKGNVWLLCAETQHSMIDILETVCEVSNSVIPWLKVKCMAAVFGRYKVKQEWGIKGLV